MRLIAESRTAIRKPRFSRKGLEVTGSAECFTSAYRWNLHAYRAKYRGGLALALTLRARRDIARRSHRYLLVLRLPQRCANMADARTEAGSVHLVIRLGMGGFAIFKELLAFRHNTKLRRRWGSPRRVVDTTDGSY